MQTVIIIPGLGDDVRLLQHATKDWAENGLDVVLFPLHWRDHEHFETKLQRLRDMTFALSKKTSSISVVGCSAGGSAALNLFIDQNNIVGRTINVCGRLRQGTQTGFRSFKAKTKSSISFAESVQLFERHESSLTKQQRERIMTIHSLFGDQLVPAETTTLEGAYNITIPTTEHTISIYMALSLFSEPLINFLNKS